jgi:hypothetical protein
MASVFAPDRRRTQSTMVALPILICRKARLGRSVSEIYSQSVLQRGLIDSL